MAQPALVEEELAIQRSVETVVVVEAMLAVAVAAEVAVKHQTHHQTDSVLLLLLLLELVRMEAALLVGQDQ